VHLSPLTRRRLAIFRSHKRGYWSLWIFLSLFGLTLFAEFIANDARCSSAYDGHWYVPVSRTIAKDTFGDDFMPTEADYKDPECRRRSTPRLDDLAGNRLHLQHRGEATDDTGAVTAGRQEPAGNRRPGA